MVRTFYFPEQSAGKGIDKDGFFLLPNSTAIKGIKCVYHLPQEVSNPTTIVIMQIKYKSNPNTIYQTEVSYSAWKKQLEHCANNKGTDFYKTFNKLLKQYNATTPEPLQKQNKER